MAGNNGEVIFEVGQNWLDIHFQSNELNAKYQIHIANIL